MKDPLSNTNKNTSGSSLLALGTRHGCAGLIAALLVAAANVAFVGIIGDLAENDSAVCSGHGPQTQQSLGSLRYTARTEADA